MKILTIGLLALLPLLAGCVTMLVDAFASCDVKARDHGNVTCSEAQRIGYPQCGDVPRDVCTELIRSKGSQKIDVTVQNKP